MSWLTILVAVNLSIWALFGYLVSRRRWTGASLAVASLHMVLIAPMSIAPLRAMTEPDTFHLGLGWVQISGAAAAVPALIVWSWGLFVAVVALARPTGRALSMIAIGDLVLVGNFATFFTVTALQGMLREFNAQGGEFLSLAGLGWAAVFLLFFVVPFTYSALWALRHMRPSEPTAPSIGIRPARAGDSKDRQSDSGGGRSLELRAARAG